jgi:hypothetical protein
VTSQVSDTDRPGKLSVVLFPPLIATANPRVCSLKVSRKSLTALEVIALKTSSEKYEYYIKSTI